MNESKHNHRLSPRLICRAVRQWESSFGPAEGETWVAERHMETCDECQAFFAEDVAFEESLRRGAVALSLKSEPDAGFDLRILQAVRESVPSDREEARVSERERRGGRAWSLGFSLAAVAAGVALALVVVQRNGTPENGGPVLAVGGGQLEETADGSVTTPAAWWSSVEARSSALELVRSNPLQQEIDSISTDAQSVIGFLAMNFLPSVEAEKTEKPRSAAGQG